MQKYLPSPPCVVEKRRLFDYDPHVLSLIGDGVHTLFIRTMLSFSHPYGINDLHQSVCGKVCAASQAKAMKTIEPALNEEENFIFKKCKNAHANNIPRHASLIEYKLASGFEGVIGYLYLSGQGDRLAEILTLVYGEEAKE